MNNNKISIYVACHKPFTIPFINNSLKYIEVGARLHTKHFLELLDDVGENISDKNLSYNELTALYWAWKNDKTSLIKGLCHYRRYFVDQASNLPISNDKINDILSKKDIICRKTNLKKPSIKHIESNMSALRPEDIPVVYEILDSLYGQKYIHAFNCVLNRNWNYLYNMFIAKAEVFNAYCAWLFPILDEISKRVDYNVLVGNEKRIFGLWAEYLLSVFIEANKLKIEEVPVIQIELS